MKISIRTRGQVCIALILWTGLGIPEGDAQSIEPVQRFPTMPSADGVLSGPGGHPRNGSLIPINYGGINTVTGRTGHLEFARIFANQKYGVQGNRHHLNDAKYVKYAYQFRATGLATWESYRHSRIDHFNKYASFFFSGNCHTIITAAHVLFKKNGQPRGPDFYFYPDGNVKNKPLRVNYKTAESERRLHYIKNVHLGSDRGESDDVVGISLRQDVANCGAYRILPLSNIQQKKLMENNGLISVGFDGGAQNLQGIPQMLFDPHCRALTGNRVNLPWLKHVGFQPHNLLFNDCDDLPGRSGSPILINFKNHLYAVGVMVAQVSIKDQPHYKSTQGVPVPIFYKQFHGNVVPNGRYYKYQFPNIAVRFRSSYLEKHPNLNIQSMSNKKYGCLRAREIRHAPAFWIVEDTIRDYHQTGTLRDTLKSCQP